MLNNPVDGVYCSSVRIDVTGLRRGDNHLTLVAPVINIPNTLNNSILSSYLTDPSDPNRDLVLWQNGLNQNFVFDHNNPNVNGVIWIENGDLTFAGNRGTTGFYEAQNVTISGNSYVMHGSGPTVGGTPGSTEVTGRTIGLDE
jgi:hypothetical protein